MKATITTGVKNVGCETRLKCDGCSSPFWSPHFIDHYQQLMKQFDCFRQKLTAQSKESRAHPLLQQINQWEWESIGAIRQKAEELRQLSIIHTNTHIGEIELRWNKLSDQLRQFREENHSNEVYVHQWKQELTSLEAALENSPAVKLTSTSRSLVAEIDIEVFTPLSRAIESDRKWEQQGSTVAGGHGQGRGRHQLSGPFSCCIDDANTICVADYLNHRIVTWKNDASTGVVIAGTGRPGPHQDQLSHPVNVIIDQENDCFLICDQRNKRVLRWPRQSGVQGETIIANIDCYASAMDDRGSLYVSDTRHHAVRRWRAEDSMGTIVAGGNGPGDKLNQLNYPTFIFIDKDEALYIADNDNHRVMKWPKDATEGIVVAGGHGEGNAANQLVNPRGLLVDQSGAIYVADGSNDRVMRWMKGAQEGTVIVGGNGRGSQADQLNYPCELLFDRQGHLYVVDSNNHRVQRFYTNSGRTT